MRIQLFVVLFVFQVWLLVVGFGPGPHWQGPGLADLPGYSVLVVGDGWPVCA
jgi:hypothetical protein